jgi:DNA-directed RNA polymerase I, II, and III subunit RPABC2
MSKWHTSPSTHSSFYDDGLDPEDAYDPEAELMAGDDAELEDGNQGIVDGNDPSGLTGESANLERITTPYMTKYERARILGTRALQIR